MLIERFPILVPEPMLNVNINFWNIKNVNGNVFFLSSFLAHEQKIEKNSFSYSCHIFILWQQLLMFLKRSSALLLCHIFCCGSLLYTFLAPEQAAFYMLLQKSSLFLCHIFCCGSLPCTFVAPEQEIESNLCYYDFQPFKHPSLQLLIFIHTTQLGHIKSSAVGLGHSFSLYHLKVLKTPRPSASDFHSRATPHSQAILMPPPPGWGNNVKYTSLDMILVPLI